MQRNKAGIVAIGALATVAAMGSAASAAPAKPAQVDSAKPATTTLGIGQALASKQQATQQAKQQVLEPSIDQPLISIGVGSKVSALAWDICGSTAVAGVGATGAANSPHTVLSDDVACANSNAKLKQDNVQGVISILDDSALRIAPWQVCGSHVVAGVGLTATLNSPATVIGDCHNSNTLIEAPDDPQGYSTLSLLSGSVINILPWQVCGSSAVMGVGAVVAASSPTTVIGDCTNAGTLIEPRPNQANAPILGNVPLNVLPLQVCETNSLASLLGIVLAPGSPATVTGECYTPDGLPDNLDLKP